jgi:hypothetical protein
VELLLIFFLLYFSILVCLGGGRVALSLVLVAVMSPLWSMGEGSMVQLHPFSLSMFQAAERDGKRWADEGKDGKINFLKRILFLSTFFSE